MEFFSYVSGKILRSIFLLITLILLSIKPLFAQVFPVQAYINVTPPYSVYLSQYTASDQEKILATILLRDPVITSIDVKFRFTIQGAGIKLTTNPSWNPAPYNLVSGLSVILPQDMIADYLKPQHLLIEGIDQQEFYRSGKLPEGYYQFKVEVIEYRRNITISNTAQAGLWLMLNEPPRIVFPLPNQKVMATNPQMINFTWVPGGVSSPQSSLTTQYEFTLVELADKSVDPYIAITTASNATKYVKTLDQTNLFYGPGEMQLTPGKSYAIRVRAYTTDGFDMFKNNGYSDVRVFTFGDACAAPVSFTLQNPNQSSFEVSVVTDPTNTAWQARFRESSFTDGQWSELKSEPGTSIKTIRGLKASTSYDVQIKGICGDIPSDYSLTQTIQTTEMVNSNRSCSNSASTFIAKNAPALTNLKNDDVFLAGLFPIKVKSVTSQGGGKFSGLGIATLPLFNTGIGVTFDNVGINELMQLTSGEVKGVRDQFNITLFGDSQTTTTGGGSGSTTGGQTTGGATYPPITDTVTIPSVYDSLVIVDNNTILVYTPTGTQTYTVNLGGNSSTLVVPADHNMDNAKIIYDNAVHPYTPGQGGSMNTEPKDFKGFIAYFTDKYQLHGFDTLYPGISKLANYYKQFPIVGKQFYVPWKALKVDQPEPIDLLIKQGTDKLPFSSVKVKQLYIGDITPSGGAGTQNQTFMVKGSYKGAEDNVIAYYNADDKEQIAGGIYLATYGEEKFKLILVPLPNVTVDNIKIGGLQQELNQIYSQAIVSWNVSQFNGFAGVDLGENGLDWADKDMLSSYNPEMNSLISAFRDWKNDADPDAYYLFVVPKFSEENVEGFMPRNRRFGFATQSQLDGRTIAHELGHGAFNLHHTFSTSGWNISQGSTNNLMDYAQGIKLYKPQWDLIHNPEATTGLFDGMDEGASKIDKPIAFFKNSFIPSDNTVFNSKDCKECLNDGTKKHWLISYLNEDNTDELFIPKSIVGDETGFNLGGKVGNLTVSSNSISLLFDEKTELTSDEVKKINPQNVKLTDGQYLKFNVNYKPQSPVSYISIAEPTSPPMAIEYKGYFKVLAVDRIKINIKDLKIDFELYLINTKNINDAFIDIYDKNGNQLFRTPFPKPIDLKIQDGAISIVNKKYTFEWDGKKNIGTSTGQTITNDDLPLKLKIGYSTVDEAKNTKSYSKEADFPIDIDLLKWCNFKFKGKIKSAKEGVDDFTRYKELKEMYSFAIGEQNDPIDWLNENLVEGKFFGSTVLLSKQYLYVLKKFEEDLYKNDRTLFNKINNNLNIEVCSRFSDAKSNGVVKVSDHALGFAFDFIKKYNPCLHSPETKNYNEVVAYIYMATGEYFNQTKTIDEIFDAAEKFKARVVDSNLDLDVLKQSCSYIDDYKTKDTYQLSVLAKEDNDIAKRLHELESNNTPDAIAQFKTKIEQLKELAKAYNNLYLFDKLDNLKSPYSSLIGYTNNIIACIEEIRLNKTKTLTYPSGLNAILEHVKSYEEKLSQVNSSNNKYATIYAGLINNINNQDLGIYGSMILKNGLCNLNKDFVKSILHFNLPQVNAVNWGANWPNYYDIMHFQLDRSLRLEKYDFNKSYSDFKDFNFSKTY